jgi:hypothetical protein
MTGPVTDVTHATDVTYVSVPLSALTAGRHPFISYLIPQEENKKKDHLTRFHLQHPHLFTPRSSFVVERLQSPQHMAAKDLVTREIA